MSAVLVVAASACAPDELPTVARGRYVEIATDRDEPVCAGTVAFMDAYVETVAGVLGETLPDRVFVRYEWIDAEEGLTTSLDGRRLIQAGTLPNEHELVHAVHREVWPATRPVFYEGLAVLFDNRGFLRTQWPQDESLDPLLEADDARDIEYRHAWFLVSQIVRDHGFTGLRQLWAAVPPDASAAEIRETYQDLFQRPIEALFEPIVYLPGTEFEYELPRGSCHFDPCVGEPMTWDEDAWSAAAPAGCEEDPAAIGVSTGPSRELGNLWRAYVAELDELEYRATTSGTTGVVTRPCELRCDWDFDDHPYGSVGPDDGTRTITFGAPGRVRFETSRALADLPTDMPGTFELRPLAP